MKRLVCGVMVLGFVAMLVLPAAAEEDATRKVLKQGIVGAATGAVVAKESDGKAGKGALIGAGTTVVGGALMDVLMPEQKTAPAAAQYPQQQPVYAPQQQAPVVYAPQAPQQATTADAQSWYQKGYNDGFKAGYQEGRNSR